MKKSMKTYVITVAKTFPAYHPRAGQPTGFRRAILAGEKIHTIRKNYPLWAKRIKEVEEGKAELSLREWSGKPYRSKQVEFLRLGREHGVGVQPFKNFDGFKSQEGHIGGHIIICQQDGLSFSDFVSWFVNHDGSTVACIHFTPFRYPA